MSIRRFEEEKIPSWYWSLLEFYLPNVKILCRVYDILLDYVNSKTSEITITSNDWEKCFSFLKFLKVFLWYMCFIVYIFTSCIALRCICNMSDVFQQYREYHLFSEICVQMEYIYWKTIPPLYCLATCIYGSKD